MVWWPVAKAMPSRSLLPNVGAALLALAAVLVLAHAVAADGASDRVAAPLGSPLDLPGVECGAVEVAGIGAVCLEPDGLWRVFSRDGTDQGTIEPPHLYPSFDPVTGEEVAGPAGHAGAGMMGGTSAPYCITAGEQYYTKIFYVRSSDDTNGYTTTAPLIREMVEMMDYKLASTADDGGWTTDLRVECSGGQIVVHNVVIPTSKSSASFSAIRNDMINLGYNDPKVHYLVLYDHWQSGLPGGTGNIANDASNSVSNRNNGNNAYPHYAVSYRSSGWSKYSIASILLHEWGHNSGAVQLSAPNTSGGWHCNDGTDVMCYNDGGAYSSGYTSSVCPSGYPWDCNQDDYFNSAPWPDNYLWDHWNLGDKMHRYLKFSCTGGPPSAPLNLAAAPNGMPADGAVLTWDHGTYPGCGVTAYEIYRDGSLLATVPAEDDAYEDRPLAGCTTYTYEVRAYSPDGGYSAFSTPETYTHDPLGLGLPCVVDCTPLATTIVTALGSVSLNSDCTVTVVPDCTPIYMLSSPPLVNPDCTPSGVVVDCSRIATTVTTVVGTVTLNPDCTGTVDLDCSNIALPGPVYLDDDCRVIVDDICPYIAGDYGIATVDDDCNVRVTVLDPCSDDLENLLAPFVPAGIPPLAVLEALCACLVDGECVEPCRDDPCLSVCEVMDPIFGAIEWEPVTLLPEYVAQDLIEVCLPSDCGGAYCLELCTGWDPYDIRTWAVRDVLDCLSEECILDLLNIDAPRAVRDLLCGPVILM